MFANSFLSSCRITANPLNGFLGSRSLDLRASNPDQQLNQQNGMSCATCVFLGSSRSLLSCCKAYPAQIHTVVVTGSSPVAPTIFLKALPGTCRKARFTNLPQELHHLRGQTHILRPHGKDSSLRQWGFHLAARGGKQAKNRAVVAVARKLAVLLHRIWSTQENYIAFYAEGA